MHSSNQGEHFIENNSKHNISEPKDNFNITKTDAYIKNLIKPREKLNFKDVYESIDALALAPKDNAQSKESLLEIIKHQLNIISVVQVDSDTKELTPI